MAQTITLRAPRAVKTKTNAPPVVKTFVAGEAIGLGEFVVVKNSDNKVYRCDGTILTAAELIDVSDLTLAGEGLFAGLTMGKAATGDTVVVALACNENIFEANLTSSTDGAAVVANVLDVTDVGQPVAVILQTISGKDTFALTDIEGTEGMGYVLDVGYGFAGESADAGHGVIGDSNARVRFYFSDALIRTNLGLLLYGG